MTDTDSTPVALKPGEEGFDPFYSDETIDSALLVTEQKRRRLVAGRWR